MSTDSNVADGWRGAVGELVNELGSLVPRLFERSRDQLAVAAKLLEQLPCLGALVGGEPTPPERPAPDLRLVTTDHADDAEVESTPPVTRSVAKKAPAKKAPAKKAPAKKAPAKKAPAKKAPAKAGGSGLAIPDYDQLAASQVIPRLDSMSPEELEAVRVHETSNRQRRTILSRIAQLQTA